MAIYRSDKTNGNFTQISNSLLRDMRLSSKAKYLLIFMLSLPDSWVYSTEGLQAVTGMTKGVLSSALHELEENGYLLRSRTRSSDGRIGKSKWEIFEEPIDVQLTDTSHDAPEVEKPSLDNPTAVSPTAENRTLQIKEEQRKDQTNVIDLIDDARAAREEFEFKLATPELIKRFGSSQIDGIIMLLTDTLMASDQLCKIGKEKIPKELVADRFLSLEPDHITYVLDCLKKLKKPIKNIKSYMLSALYSAPTTVESYYETLSQEYD